jgi:MoaA/NifB/PqqE/SkfB family radical SAM enzyme
MEHKNRPYRAILNFAHKCAMSCEWCYVPFGQIPAQERVVASVIDRISELGFTSLTVGGGDPFQYGFIAALLKHSKSLGLFVHVDTHGKSLRETYENLSLIENNVDLIGLPMDGSMPAIHDLMRGASGHFDLINKRLSWLHPLRSRLKINTVCSAVNVANIFELSQHVRNYEPSRWSVYQYWPLGPGTKAALKHSLPDSIFAHATETLPELFAKSLVKVEINGKESRRVTYPIIHHDGEVFVHSPAPANTFISLGSIFEGDIMAKISTACKGDRPAALSRYT